MLSRWCLIFSASFIVISYAHAETPEVWVEKNLGEIVNLYQHLHAHPELSFQEKETAARLAGEFSKIGGEVTTEVGGHGVVALLKNGVGPTLMLRTDLDALPVTEQTEVRYASNVRVKKSDGSEVGVMHACGHDIHMSNIVGVARYLSANKDQWKGTVMFIGQPAEERGAGARAMLDDGLFKRFPKPDVAIALHVDSMLAAGRIGVKSGYAMANVDSVDITMLGKGGHGAYPHATIDPVVLAAHLVIDLQTVVSREIKPIEPAVITVGSIHGGTKHNIISDRCHLQLTVRSYSKEVRKHLLDAIGRKAKAVAIGANAPAPILKFSEGTPALYNNDDLAARLVPIFRQVVGKENVINADPSMGGEDFGRYGREGVPILMYRLGAVDAKRLERYKQLGVSPPSLHSSKFYPDAEDTLRTGITTMASAVLELMGR